MALRFRPEVHIEKGRELNGGFTPAFVFSWADDENEDRHVKSVRVQADESVVRNWGINWFRDADVQAAFRARRDAWLSAAANAKDDGRDYRVFEIPQ